MKCIEKRFFWLLFFFKRFLKSKTLLANDGRLLGCEKMLFSVHKMYTACNIYIMLSSFTGL